MQCWIFLAIPDWIPVWDSNSITGFTHPLTLELDQHDEQFHNSIHPSNPMHAWNSSAGIWDRIPSMEFHPPRRVIPAWDFRNDSSTGIPATPSMEFQSGFQTGIHPPIPAMHGHWIPVLEFQSGFQSGFHPQFQHWNPVSMITGIRRWIPDWNPDWNSSNSSIQFQSGFQYWNCHWIPDWIPDWNFNSITGFTPPPNTGIGSGCSRGGVVEVE